MHVVCDDQQQLAYMRPFIPWQITQIIRVSLQLSTQKGMQQHTPVNRNTAKHQIHVTPPGALFWRLSVYLRQKGHATLPGKRPLGTKP